MKRNVEIKARVKNFEELNLKAKELSHSDGQIIKQHDIFYKPENGRLKLRIFENTTSELIFYNRPDEEGPKLSSYERCDLNADQTGALKNVLGATLKTIGEVKKTRLLYMVGQTRVHVDTVEDLGNFMELEVMLNPEQTLEDGQQIAYSLMEQLGIDKSDLLSNAYIDMLQNKNRREDLVEDQ